MKYFIELSIATDTEGVELIAAEIMPFSAGGVAVEDVNDFFELRKSGAMWDMADGVEDMFPDHVLVKGWFSGGGARHARRVLARKYPEHILSVTGRKVKNTASDEWK
ncbi:MAG: hypothetical protein FWE62_07135, partial [Firmicutes bacterium]|nr:hypothetical protein [Bacillota bacterium]